jgi:hypothetical protein
MQRLRAKKWYRWLWLSPLLTLPTLIILMWFQPWYVLPVPFYDDWRFVMIFWILGSALWHLILLVPARDREAPFVRWHGRQALLLAGVRTAVPLALGMAYPWEIEMLLAVPLLIVVWFAGTMWGQRQAARGDCSLMRWAGHDEELLALQRAEREAEPGEPDPDRLEEIIRYSRDPEERRNALSELERLELVEPL